MVCDTRTRAKYVLPLPCLPGFSSALQKGDLDSNLGPILREFTHFIMCFLCISGGTVCGDSGSSCVVVLHQHAHGVPRRVLRLPQAGRALPSGHLQHPSPGGPYFMMSTCSVLVELPGFYPFVGAANVQRSRGPRNAESLCVRGYLKSGVYLCRGYDGGR